MAPLQAVWGAVFTCFAFDLPGFGLSDLPAGIEVTTANLADTIAEGMAGLGLDAGRALWPAHRGRGGGRNWPGGIPTCVSMLLTDGLSGLSGGL